MAVEMINGTPPLADSGSKTLAYLDPLFTESSHDDRLNLGCSLLAIWTYRLSLGHRCKRERPISRGRYLYPLVAAIAPM